MRLILLRNVGRAVGTRVAANTPLGAATSAARATFATTAASEPIGSRLPDEPLDFSIKEVNCHIRYDWKDGAWNDGKLVEEPYIRLHVNSNVLHYGQALFEGLKAFHGQDGKVRVLNPEENAKRMQYGCGRMAIPDVPSEMFHEGIDRVVRANAGFIPKYGNGSTLYLRPNVFGHGPQIGLSAAPEYSFIVSVHPVGNYFQAGPVPAQGLVILQHDRAASSGMGDVKTAGNYAADLVPASKAKQQGYSMGLYLDARERKYVEEFGTSNFVGLTKDGAYATPDSTSVLRSITNMMMEGLAQHRGMKTERRRIDVEELATFQAAGGCGTAVVYQPLKSLTYKDRVFEFDPDAHQPLHDLAQYITQVGFGEAEDVLNWTREVPL